MRKPDVVIVNVSGWDYAGEPRDGLIFGENAP
jgi:hypothetical protein